VTESTYFGIFGKLWIIYIRVNQILVSTDPSTYVISRYLLFLSLSLPVCLILIGF
jgi:hypothetical protein